MVKKKRDKFLRFGELFKKLFSKNKPRLHFFLELSNPCPKNPELIVKKWI